MRCEIGELRSVMWDQICEMWDVKHKIWRMRSEIRNVRWEIWAMRYEIWDVIVCELWNMTREEWDLRYQIWEVKRGLWKLRYDTGDLRYGKCDRRYELWDIRTEITAYYFVLIITIPYARMLWLDEKSDIWELKFEMRDVITKLWDMRSETEICDVRSYMWDVIWWKVRSDIWDLRSEMWGGRSDLWVTGRFAHCICFAQTPDDSPLRRFIPWTIRPHQDGSASRTNRLHNVLWCLLYWLTCTSFPQSRVWMWSSPHNSKSQIC